MRDSVELEWAGIPSATIIHTAMHGSAKAIARVSGMPDIPFIEVDYPHIPTAVWTDEECAEVAREVAPKVKALLLGTF